VEPRTYRTQLWLRLAMLSAAVFWASVLAALARLPGAPFGSVLSALAFLAFFIVFGAHYGRMAVVVTPECIVFCSFFRRVPVRWDEILKVEVRPGLAGTLYAVLTRRGLVQFSSLLARHREVFQLLLERARLAPSR
jgi:hypothetical protein